MNKRIYHVSKIHDLSIIEPHICSHDRAYVYASYHLETALLFGGELWTDWDFIYKRNYDTGELTFSETYLTASTVKRFVPILINFLKKFFIF